MNYKTHKSHLLFSLSACLLLIGCEKENKGMPSIDSSPIHLQTFLPSTRAAHLWSMNGGGDYDPLLEFGVFAYYNGTESIMGNNNGGQIVSRNSVGSEWNYIPIRWWPGNGFIDFYAYAPTKEGGRSGNGTITGGPSDGIGQRSFNAGTPPTIDFIVDGYSEFQTDLLLAIPQKGQTRDDVLVSMPLRHVLTRISFSARIDDELAQYAPEIKVKVDKIVLKNIYSHGTHAMDASQPWIIDMGNNAHKREFALERIPTVGTNELADIELNGSYQKITTKNGNLLMLPQPMNTEKEITVTFRITLPGREDALRSFKIALQEHSPDWQQGDALNYQLLLRNNAIVLTVFGLPGSPGTPNP